MAILITISDSVKYLFQLHDANEVCLLVQPNPKRELFTGRKCYLWTRISVRIGSQNEAKAIFSQICPFMMLLLLPKYHSALPAPLVTPGHEQQTRSSVILKTIPPLRCCFRPNSPEQRLYALSHTTLPQPLQPG